MFLFLRQEGQHIFIRFQYYNPEKVAIVKTFPDRRYIPESKEWRIPASHLELVYSRFPDDEISLSSEMVLEAEQGEEDVRTRLEGITPIIDFDFKTTPYPHQIEAFNYGIENPVILIGDEQGLGKTKEAIDITVGRKRKDGLRGVLIICGVNSTKYNWKQEIKVHSDETVQVIEGSTQQKLKQLKECSRYFYNIINIEALRKEQVLNEIIRLIDDGILQAIIFDEIHKARNGQSQQGKALQKLQPPIKIGLTGTPLMKNAEDLWNILHWLEVEKGNYWQFRNRYCIMGGFKGKQIIGHKNLDELRIKLNSVMLRRKKDEVLDLPEKIHTTEYIELTERQKIKYAEIRSGILSTLYGAERLNGHLSILTKLRQCVVSLELLDAGADSPKFDRIEEMLEEEIIPNGRKAIIFSQWTSVTRILKKRFKQYNPAYITGEVKLEDREKEVRRFQEDDDCKLCIGTIPAMGAGLTLTAGNYVFFTDKAWLQKDNEQAEDRAHRIGQGHPVQIVSLVAVGTIEERIEELLANREELFSNIVEGKSATGELKDLILWLLE